MSCELPRALSGIASLASHTIGPAARTRRALQIRSPMSHDSSKSLEAQGASQLDKFDIYDANIRNFAPVARIMKMALPENAKIAKEAKECMQECVSEFISFITSEGRPKAPRNDRCSTRVLLY